MLVKCFFWQRQDLGEDLPFRFFYMQQYTGQLQCQPAGRRRSSKLEMGLWSGPTTAVQTPEGGKSQPLALYPLVAAAARGRTVSESNRPLHQTHEVDVQRLVAALPPAAAVCLSLSPAVCRAISPLPCRAGGGAERASQPASQETRTARRAARLPCLGRTWPGFRGDFTGRWRPPLQFGRAACPQMQIVVGTHQHL